LFWNIKIAETKLEHKEEAILNFYKEFFLDILQFISTAVTSLQAVSSKRNLKKLLGQKKDELGKVKKMLKSNRTMKKCQK